MRHEFHHRRRTLLELEAVFLRSEYKTGIALRVGPVGIEINFEAMLPVLSGDLQLHFGPLLHMDGRRVKLIFLGSHFNDLSILIRLRSVSWTGGTSGDGKADSQKHRKKSSRDSQLNFSFQD